MLENKEQEKIAGIISDFFDGQVTEADIDILALKIYEKYVAKLKQQLEEKDKEIAHLKEMDNYHLLYELAGADETITNLKQQLAEKDKEIEKIKTKQKPIVMHSKENYYFLEEENIKLHFAQKQLAITELEKVKASADKWFESWETSKYEGNIYDKLDVSNAYLQMSCEIDQQIKELKGGK